MSTPISTLLFCPATAPDKVAKIPSTGADSAAIDLEDAVNTTHKVAARAIALESITSSAFRNFPVFVRINDTSTGLTEDDIAGVVHPHLDGIVLSKASSPADIDLADAALARAERAAGIPIGSIGIIPLLETAAGVHRAVDILSASSRVRTAIFGFVDYMLDVGIHSIDHTPDADELLYARSAVVMACRVAGIQPPLDGPFLGIRTPEALLAQCRQARRMGYAGKMLIHPSQVGPAREGFAPDPEEVEQAKNIVRAFTEADRLGKAAIVVDGRLVDYPVVARARRILEGAL
ncbi:CoA ester lyase [Arthrobacter sp. SDTb3-6]|uniref:HpcH/HpaI aldolase/citrate lyase family protein n=1 Tax=Arthrobacter sp. SDTb3-6 TaxID=2713571 RepID=UPI00159E496F|nr:CoA ester lyase [Arthrobacter sp. SDTb3-6]NVM98488.1 CoA ester lyase [Arthrobacter sp. SDTb3-6]